MSHFQFFTILFSWMANLKSHVIQCYQVKCPIINILIFWSTFKGLNFTNLSNPQNLRNLSTSKQPTVHYRLFSKIQSHMYTSTGTVHRYRSRAIAHYFTGGEIITEPKVCVILRYFVKMAHNIHSQVGRTQSIEQDRTAWINVCVFKWNISKGRRFHRLTFSFLHIADNIVLNTIRVMLFCIKKTS